MKHTIQKLSVTLFFLACTLSSIGQTSDWRDYLQQLEENGASLDLIESMNEDLSDLEASPFNINTVSINDLERIPFLSEEQRQSMNDFFTKNRPIYSVFELRNIPLLDIETVKMMLPFFYVGEMNKKGDMPNLLEMLKDGKHEFQMRFDKVFPKRAGYKPLSDSILTIYPNRVYQGEDFYNSVKYYFSARKKIKAGFVAEKDAGEPLLKGSNKGYDFYGGYIALTDLGRLKSLVVGDYNLSFGQGLILNNIFSLGKTSETVAILRRTTLPRQHSSTSEAGFFRGVASSLNFGNFNFTAFYSHHNIDANISGDSVITSLKTDGYHRTQLEQSKKGNVLEQVVGGHIQYDKNRLQIGLSLLLNSYGKPVQPTFYEYNRFYFKGKTNLNGSVDYSYRFSKLLLAGETALSQNGAVATLNALNFYPKKGISLILLQRRFDKKYQALYANAFSNSSGIQNETGWYIGTKFSPIPKLKVVLYADWASFPWLKYGINAPSHSYDYLIQNCYQVNDNLSINLRYRYRQREENEKYPDDNTTSVLKNDLHKLFFWISNNVSSWFDTRTMLEWNFRKVEHAAGQTGWMISQVATCQSGKRWKADMFIGYFNADSYDVAVYSHERNISSNFYMPSFYGKGIRSSLTFKYNVKQNFLVAIYGAMSNYFDRNSISSGLEEIGGNRRIDVMSYLSWKF